MYNSTHMRLTLTLLLLIPGFIASPPETTRWETFTNRSGWSIDYPANWKISSCHSCPDPSAPDVLVDFSPPGVQDSNQGWLMIERLADKPANKSLDEWLAEVKSADNRIPQIKEEKSTLNGLPALQVRYRNPSGNGYEMETVYVISNLKTFAISFQGKEGSSIESLGNYAIYRRMLSTFKITRRP